MIDKAKLEDLQAANTRKSLKDLKNVRTILESLIQSSNEVTELRSLRTRLTSIISEVQNPNFEKFSKKAATIDEFNAGEKMLVESSEKLSLELERQSKAGIDVKAITRLVESAEDAVHGRIPLTKDLKDLYIKSIKKEQKEKKKPTLPKEVSSELILYLNTLLTKYASYHPEVLHTGDYILYAIWNYEAGENSVTARLTSGFGTPLFLEARWQDDSESMVEDVLKEANDVKKNSYKCLCLVNSAWNKENRDFAFRFSHPQLALYLYELKGELLYNKEVPAAKQYAFWFNIEQKYETLKERAMKFAEAHEYFTAQDMADAFGMKTEGADALLGELEKKGVVANVSFRSDRVKKYTKAKAGI